MRCDYVRKQIPRYVIGELTDMEVVAMDDHLDRCDACMEAVNNYLAEHGFLENAMEKEEFLRVIRIPMPSPERVQEGVNAVLHAIRIAETPTATPPFSTDTMSCKSVIASWSEWLRVLGGTIALRWAHGLMAITVVGLIVFVWNRETQYRAFEQRFTTLIGAVDALKRQNDLLRQEIVALQRQIAQVSVNYEKTMQFLAEERMRLEERVSQLQQENKALEAKFLKPSTPPQVLLALQDELGMVMVRTDGTVHLAGKSILPSPLANSVRQFVTTGTVTPTKPVLIAMATLKSDAMRNALRSVRSEEKFKPIPLSPVLTAIRSICPTLRWMAVPGTQEYKVRIVDRGDKLIWEGSAGTQTQVTLPSGVLQRGQVYFWQVEAILEEQSILSPAVGFWVLSERELSEVETIEQKYKASALVCASVYAVHGLYEEALSQVERLMDMNPTNPLVQVMRHNLYYQLGREEHR